MHLQEDILCSRSTAGVRLQDSFYLMDVGVESTCSLIRIFFFFEESGDVYICLQNLQYIVTNLLSQV